VSAPAFASWSALGTTATVAVTEPEALSDAIVILEDWLESIDRACSRFRSDSEISLLARGGTREHEASDVLLDALEAGLRAARLTDGLVTPTLGRSLRLAGYDRDLAAIHPVATPARLVPAPDWRSVVVDLRRRTVLVPAGVELDLGATAKAFAADRAALEVAGELGCGVLVSLGGDLRVAGEPPARGWPVDVDDVHDLLTSGAQRVRISSGGVATSSTTSRRWRRRDRELHHLLDPRTGAPAGGAWRTATVAAATCVDANTASTAAILLGERAPAWLAERGLPARLVANDGTTLAVGGWPEQRLAA
jgi:thiamine biosynthesis lipoprotein